MSVARILEQKEICICAGPGGAGKTTTSAALALGMAAEGRRVAVVTIDPARRLAAALGLPEVPGPERRVDPEWVAAAGPGTAGEVWAMVLDPKRTFDDLVRRHAPDPAARNAVLSNRIYQELSSAVAGSQEYMAMEKLLELHEERRYDLLVLDTPPARSALGFLDAPERLSRFIDSRSLQILTGAGHRGVDLAGRGGALLFGGLRRVTGVDLLRDLSEFFQSFAGMTEALGERVAAVTALLRHRQTTFLLVSSPQRHSAAEAVFLHRQLRERRMPSGGAIVNRVTPVRVPTQPEDAGVEAELTRPLGRPLARRVARNLADYRALAERDRQSLDLLERELAPDPLIPVPLLSGEVQDIAGLVQMNEHLFAPDAVAA